MARAGKTPPSAVDRVAAVVLGILALFVLSGIVSLAVGPFVPWPGTAG